MRALRATAVVVELTHVDAAKYRLFMTTSPQEHNTDTNRVVLGVDAREVGAHGDRRTGWTGALPGQPSYCGLEVGNSISGT